MCLDDKTLSAYIDGELSEPWKTQVEEHLVHCQICKERYEQLVLLSKHIQAARIQDYEFEEQKERIWKYLKNSVISKEPKQFLKRRFYIRTPTILGVAAAFVCLFALNIFIVKDMSARSDVTETPIPVITSMADEPTGIAEKRGEMLQVSATDSVAVAKILDDLSVEDILMLLDKKGFDVDLRLKDVTEIPVTFDVTSDSADILKESASIPEEGAAVPDENAEISEDNGAAVPDENVEISEDGAAVPDENAEISEDGAAVPDENAEISEDNGATTEENTPVNE